MMEIFLVGGLPEHPFLCFLLTQGEIPPPQALTAVSQWAQKQGQ